MKQGQMLLTLCWRSCLGHSPDVLTNMFCRDRLATVQLWVKVTAKTSGFSLMQCQKSFLLRWQWFLGGSSDAICTIFAHRGRHYYDYGYIPLHSQVIIQDVRPEIIDVPLTLISIMGQGVCGFPSSLIIRLILLLWRDVTMQPGDCWIDMTMNRWCSVDAHLRAHLRDILTVIGYSSIVQKIHTASIGSQDIVCM
jgi:hypothetical protein